MSSILYLSITYHVIHLLARVIRWLYFTCCIDSQCPHFTHCSHQADMNARGGSRRRTPLHYASLHNHVDVARLLLQAGANEFVRDSAGYTALNLSNGGTMCSLLHKVRCHQFIELQFGWNLEMSSPMSCFLAAASVAMCGGSERRSRGH